MEQSQAKSSGLKAGIQKLGRHLSSMVMPNIGAFIAWGIFAALFIPTGYLPNESLNAVGGAMQRYLLPLLIAYSGGALVYQQRGAVVATIATMGVIGGAPPETPMFIGAMAMGPFAGWVIKKFDQAFQEKIPSGFEMLVNNFSSGILGFFLALLGFFAVGPLVSWGTEWMEIGVNKIMELGFLPLANVLIELAKILFLNNAINHGILTPLGSAQVAEVGKSVLYLLEANPGPGLGVLLAFAIFGKGSAKSSSWGAMIIHFLGGIHEIYFPYVMTKPLLILAVIAGGVTGTFVNVLLNVGLTGPASPGSIFAIFGVTARGDHLQMLLAVAAAAAVSFAVAALILKTDRSQEDNFAKQQAAVSQAKAESKGQSADVEATSDEVPDVNQIDRIIFACDAGMGSSAMGASLLRKKAKQLGLTQPVTNSAINNLSDDAKTLVITQQELTPQARKKAPSSTHISVNNFMDSDRYDEILADMLDEDVETVEAEVSDGSSESADKDASQAQASDYAGINKVVFAFQGPGVGGTTIAASIFRNLLVKKAPDKNIHVSAQALEEINDQDNILVIVQSDDYQTAKEHFQKARVIHFDRLIDEGNYYSLIQSLGE
ncbi:PTS mannitol transporter subunit IICBA [Aerococcus urinae]